MSKSILDYKNEMDSIKISDNFAKRTEKIMSEQTTILMNNKPVILWKKTTTIIGTSAACIALLFAMNARRINLNQENDMITDTIVCETENLIIENENQTNEAVLYNNDVTVDNNIDTIMDLEDDAVAFSELNIKIDENNKDVISTTSLKVTENKSENTITITEKIENEANEIQNSLDVGSEANFKPINELFPYFINDVDYSTAKINFISYINDITKPLKIIYSKEDAQEIAFKINSIIENAKTTSKTSSTTLFNITIDTIADEKYFEMSLTENKQFTVICNYPDGIQKITYQLNDDEYSDMEKLLYLVFSSPGEYEDYSALKSGK